MPLISLWYVHFVNASLVLSKDFELKILKLVLSVFLITIIELQSVYLWLSYGFLHEV